VTRATEVPLHSASSLGAALLAAVGPVAVAIAPEPAFAAVT
jgi:hypothetical protein